jgi:hypothetical protein
MIHPRVAVVLLAVSLACSAQSVRSTRSGLLYFFDGYVFLGDEPLQQKFGRFPEIPEGAELRTELGHAEILLTPGVFLRIGEKSAIRLISDKLTDTRVELLRGSAILEVSREAVDPPVTVTHRTWRIRIPKEGVSRIDTEPAQLRVYSGTAEVSSVADLTVATVKRGEILPFASVLFAEPSTTPAEDAFNVWAMNRSSAISEDNEIASGITDDPDQLDPSGIALPAYSYFPQTGIPSMGIAYPYGNSVWSPYQSVFGTIYPSYYPFLPAYRAWPGSTRLYPRPTITPGSAFGSRPIGANLPRPGYVSPGSISPGGHAPRTVIAPPRVAPAPGPHVAPPHPVIHR